eukprot:jgi/Mesvir1/13571/Mv02990-RA.1
MTEVNVSMRQLVGARIAEQCCRSRIRVIHPSKDVSLHPLKQLQRNKGRMTTFVGSRACLTCSITEHCPGNQKCLRTFPIAWKTGGKARSTVLLQRVRAPRHAGRLHKSSIRAEMPMQPNGGPRDGGPGRKSSEAHRVKLFHGDDQEAIGVAVKSAVNEVVPHSWAEINFSRHSSGDIASLWEALDLLSMRPFGTGGRAALVTNAAFLHQARCPKEDASLLKKKMERIVPPNVLLITMALAPSTAWINALRTGGGLITSFSRVPRWERPKQVLTHARAKGLDMTPDAAQLLADIVDGDTLALTVELDKLVPLAMAAQGAQAIGPLAVEELPQLSFGSSSQQKVPTNGHGRSQGAQAALVGEALLPHGDAEGDHAAPGGRGSPAREAPAQFVVDIEMVEQLCQGATMPGAGALTKVARAVLVGDQYAAASSAKVLVEQVGENPVRVVFGLSRTIRAWLCARLIQEAGLLDSNGRDATGEPIFPEISDPARLQQLLRECEAAPVESLKASLYILHDTELAIKEGEYSSSAGLSSRRPERSRGGGPLQLLLLSLTRMCALFPGRPNV